MQNQFDHLDPDEVDPNECYYCTIYTTSKGFTILMRKVLEKNRPNILNEIEKIIDYDPEILNKQNDEGFSAAMVACLNHNGCSSLEIVKLLIRSGCNLNLTDKIDETVLMKLCYSTDNSEIIKLLINLPKEQCDINFKDELGRTALMYTLLYYNSSVNSREHIELLLNAGCDIDIQDHQGQTALMHARNIDNIKLLVQEGCNLYIKDNYDRVAFNYVGYFEKKSYLLSIIERNELMVSSLINVCVDFIKKSKEYYLEKYFSKYVNRDVMKKLIN